MTLELPKLPTPIGTHHRERRDGASDEARLLASVGERLTPDGLEYQGSFACHVYYKKLSNEFVFMNQSSDLTKVPEQVANEGIKECARALMIQYGRRPPKKIGQDNSI